MQYKMWDMQFILPADLIIMQKETDGTEEKILRILNISNSHGQDAMWLLPEVLRREVPDWEFFVAELYQAYALPEHVAAAQNDEPDYIYYTNEEGLWKKTDNVTIQHALTDQRWDVVMFNESSRYLGLDHMMSKGLVDWFLNYILENLDYKPVLLYNMTWANPTDDRFFAPDTDRQKAPERFKDTYAQRYGCDHVNLFNKLVEMTKKYLVNHEGFDKIIYNAKPIQYAWDVLGVPEWDDGQKLDLFRDYTHLSDFARLMVAYSWYAQMFAVKELTQIHVNVIPSALRATSRQIKLGDLEITQQHKKIIMESVNATLQDPLKMPDK